MRNDDVKLLQQIVNYLDNHQEKIRIKKMLYCLCINRWEKDVDYLSSINSEYLIEQILREYTTLNEFKVLLQKVLKTVNKPKQYIQVAKIIYLAIGQLYSEFHKEHSSKTTPPAVAQTPVTETTISYTSQDVASAFQRAYTPQATQIHTSLDVPSALQRVYAPLPTQVFEAEIPQDEVDEVSESDYETYYTPEIPDDIAEDQLATPDYDPFVLRQNVMSSTNPLRVKIILLVMLRPHFNFSSQSAMMMREYYLDDLLLEVMTTYRTIQDLEESMTYAVEQLVELEEYGKAATCLLQSLIPLYVLRTQAKSKVANFN